MRMGLEWLLIGCVACAASAQASEVDARKQVQVAADEVARTLDALAATPGAFPASAAVVVQGDTPPLMHVRGALRAGEATQVDRNTQFYIASQTKSFIALLAAQLDEKGVLPLDTTLAQIWPKLTLPSPADPAKITMADLLSHQENLKTDTLNFLTAYVRAVPAAGYPAMLSRYTESREPGFRYANIGDLIYGAALETRTGRTWQSWLESEVLRPLDLDIHAHTSQMPATRLAWNHRWNGSAWIASAPKPDALMHSAGGLIASPEGMAKWMRANLQRSTPAFDVAQRPIAKAKLADGEIDCNGYSLGWYTCTYKQHRVLMHPGSYTGVVSVTVLVPERDAGLSLVVTSDSAMEGVELEMMKAFIGLSTGEQGESERLRKLVAEYPTRLSKLVAKRKQAIDDAKQAPEWKQWTWSPARDDLQRYVGTFESERLGNLEVVQTETGLEARLGELRMQLTPATRDLFGASASPLEAPESFAYDASAQSIRWNDDTFSRRATP